jgi:hypothetical protein
MAKLFFVIMFSLFLGACGTMIYTSHQDVTINTTPEGVKARIGTQACATPCTLNVPRKSRKIFIIQGTTERVYTLEKNINVFTFFFGNVLWGIFPGMIVDASSGAKYSIEPVAIDVTNRQNREQVGKGEE